MRPEIYDQFFIIIGVCNIFVLLGNELCSRWIQKRMWFFHLSVR